MTRLPNDNQRSIVIGRTGSGKTRAGIWQLGERSWITRPWVIWDFKGDDLIAQIEERELAKAIKITDKPPKKPGLYIVRPLPDDNEAVEKFMWECWARGQIGLYFDEGYMLGLRNKAYRAILTQGRSKEIPLIVLSQRPVWMDRFTFSEADFFQVFNLNDHEDRKTVGRFVPIDLDQRLPDYCSVWYDVGRDEVSTFAPVPDDASILARYEQRANIRKQRGRL